MPPFRGPILLYGMALRLCSILPMRRRRGEWGLVVGIPISETPLYNSAGMHLTRMPDVPEILIGLGLILIVAWAVYNWATRRRPMP